jgi:hypothetical protein
MRNIVKISHCNTTTTQAAIMLAILAPLFLLLGASQLQADEGNVVDIVFAGGQSNATSDWADGIRTELAKGVKFSNLRMVHVYHPGSWLHDWYSNKPNKNFDSDFYNSSGTGALEKAWKEVEASGKKPRLAGFFWFQGEGDSGSLSAQKTYPQRFKKILALVQEHFDQPVQPDFAVAVIDGHQDSKFYYPSNPKGRTRDQVEGMRAVLETLGRESNGVSVDTRGAERGDMWHLSRAEKTRIGMEMAKAFVEKLTDNSEQDGADQPASAPESKPEDSKKPKPESKVRPQ